MTQNDARVVEGESTPVLSLIKMEAFGGFSKKSLGPFKPGLNVVFGKNEAGKSTTTNFITQMLYGWERATSPTHYKPNGKDRRSGSLFFEAGTGGEWEIVRKEPGSDVHTITHKGALRDNVSEELVAGVDKQTFLNVFSFNAEQLQILESGDSVTSKLLTASSATAISPVDALEKIQSQIKLYAGKVTTDSPNKSLYSLPLKRKEIEDLESEVARYKEVERENISTYLQFSELEKKREGLKQAEKVCDSVRGQAARESDAVNDTFSRLQELSRELAGDTESYEKEVALLADKTIDLAVLGAGEEIRFLAGSSDIHRAIFEKKTKLETEILLLKAKQSTMKNSGCTCDGAIQDYLEEARSQKSELEVRKQTAKEQLDEAAGEQAGVQAKIDTIIADMPQQTKNSKNPNKILIFLSLPFFIVGAVLAALGMGVLGAVAVGVGALIVLGSVLFASGTESKENSSAPVQRDFSADLQNANERVAKAQAKYEQSCFQLNSFLQETQMNLIAKGFSGGSAASPLFQTSETAFSLEDASRMLGQQLEYNAIQAQITALEIQVSQEHQAFEKWKARVVAALEISGHLQGISNNEDLFVAIENARLRYEEEAKRAEDQREVQRTVANLFDQIKRGEDRLATASDEFWSIAGGDGSGGLEYDAEKATAAVARKKQEAADAEQALFEAKRSLQEVNQQISDLRVSLGKVENDTGMQSVQMKLAEATAQIRIWTKEYLELLVAQKFLREAISQWGNTKQPQIYQEASNLFKELTLGAWTEVRPGNKEGLVVAVSADREVRDSSQLSTSTSQLLYLSLRLALLKANENIGKSLPLVMDDAFVNMDDRRSQAVVSVISRVATTRQIIVFTFREETKELFSNCCKEVNIVTF